MIARLEAPNARTSIGGRGGGSARSDAMSVPLIVTPYAAVLGLLGAALTVNVIVNRVKSGVAAGDGGAPKLAQAIRAHGNFIEQAPLALIVLVLAEEAGARPLAINLLGVLLVVSRIVNAAALNRTLANTRMRVAGGGLGIVTLTGASIVALLAMAGIS
jgi:uncharacterized membrane protein YecN with MAPEG domain